MTIKYYGKSGKTGTLIAALYYADPYRNTALNPSYCVWIVPGTIDANGNPID